MEMLTSYHGGWCQCGKMGPWGHDISYSQISLHSSPTTSATIIAYAPTSIIIVTNRVVDALQLHSCLLTRNLVPQVEAEKYKP